MSERDFLYRGIACFLASVALLFIGLKSDMVMAAIGFLSGGFAAMAGVYFGFRSSIRERAERLKLQEMPREPAEREEDFWAKVE